MSFNEAQHPRTPAGNPAGGRFASKGGFSLADPFVPGVSGIDYGQYADKDKAIRKATKAQGHELGLEDLVKLAGAVPGSRVHEIELDGSGMVGISINPLNTFGKPIGGYTRELFLTSNKIYNHSMHIDEDQQGKGLGAKMLYQQVTAAVQHGFDEIGVFAAGDPGGKSNGYYTWPRLGFLPTTAGKVVVSTVHTERAALLSGGSRPVIVSRHTKLDMVKLMSTEKGRNWWKAHGEAHGGRFDLSEGSISRRVLTAYAKAKGWE
jgi:hypothetical protein